MAAAAGATSGNVHTLRDLGADRRARDSFLPQVQALAKQAARLEAVVKELEEQTKKDKDKIDELQTRVTAAEEELRAAQRTVTQLKEKADATIAAAENTRRLALGAGGVAVSLTTGLVMGASGKELIVYAVVGAGAGVAAHEAYEWYMRE